MPASAVSLWIGNDISGPVTRYTSGGVFIDDFGMGGATGSAVPGNGFAYTVQPSGSDSVITKYDAAQTPVLTTHFTSGIENGNGFPSWIEDMAYAGGNTLWLSGFNGIVYRIDETGTIVNVPFDTGHTFAGVATDGTSLWTTEGFSGTFIDKRLLDGTFVSSFDTGISSNGGIGFDASDSTLWVGDFGVVRHYTLGGTLLGSFSTASGSFHDGLEVGEIGAAAAVPEPGAMLLLGAGVAALAAVRRFKRK